MIKRQGRWIWNGDSVQNDSSRSIRCVNVKLRRVLFICPNRSTRAYEPIYSNSFEGVPANQSFIGNSAKRMSLTIPIHAKPGTDSKTVACRYEIVVVFVPGKHGRVVDEAHARARVRTLTPL